jgi:23S rRNA pseudoU1915 N3-methylase RlmH
MARKPKGQVFPSLAEIETEMSQTRSRGRYRQALKGTAGTVVVVAAIAVLMATIILPVIRITGTSMQPGFQPGDIVVAYKTQNFQQGDVCVFYFNNKLILKRIKDGDELILLDEHGKEFRSVEWAAFLESKLTRGSRDLVFVIGGAYGFSQKVYARADSRLSLSKMTFSHQMVRTIFAEQLYRAFTIIRGEPYHHE